MAFTRLSLRTPFHRRSSSGPLAETELMKTDHPAGSSLTKIEQQFGWNSILDDRIPGLEIAHSIAVKLQKVTQDVRIHRKSPLKLLWL
jgi:hypothetical protein